MKPRRPGVCVLLICLLTGGALRADLVTNLASVADTGLRQTNPNNNLGGIDFVPAGVNAGGDKNRGLFKFDIAGKIPVNATITSVTLNLIVSQGFFGGVNYNLHRVLRDWGEGDNVGGPDGLGNLGSPADAGEATWNNRFHPGTAWGAPGAQAGVDYSSTPSASASVGGTGSTNGFNSATMAADVQAWLADPGTNFGWILIIANEGINGTARRFGSREGTNNAPLLTIQYTVPSAPLVITNATLAGNAVQFQFTAEAGQTYTVEFRGALDGGLASTLTNIPAQPSETTITITDPLTTSNRFYQVRTP